MTTPDVATIHTALEVACRAPSVHNTQSWRWTLAPHSVHLFADRARQLPVIDHDGRDLAISCGAALHHARLAFRSLGWRVDVHRLPNPACPDHLAALQFSPLPRIDAHVLALVSATARRRADRRPFLPGPIPEPDLAALVGAAQAEAVTCTVLTHPVVRREVITALGHADSVQRRDPMYAAELAEWTGRRLGAVHGVPVRNVPAHFPRAVPGRDFGPGEMDSPPPLDDGATLCLLSTAVDSEPDWLRVGEALSAVTLAATVRGLASCPISQVAEVPIVREAVRRIALDGAGEPQLVLRLGWPATAEFPGPATPRRDLADVVGEWRDY
ncbi:MAG TPA: nitroreductase [Pseudonocardiaceae bacterium]|nr:nitroreductase [Pseudonocardiaceae bacterium]